MSQEVKNAAESLRRLIPVKCPPSPRWSQDEKNLWMLAQAYLAEHDETPITREWLLSIGFEAVESDRGPRYSDHMQIGRLNIWEFGDTGEWLVNDADWMELKTRGQIFGICAALNIPLRTP